MPTPMSYTAPPPSAPGRQMGLPPEYSEKLFTNLQAMSKGAAGARRTALMDNTSRFPGMAGVQQMLLDQGQRDQADQALNTATGVQLQGVGAARDDRRTYEQRDQETEQAALNRELQKFMQQAGFQFQDKQAQNTREHQDQNFWRNAGMSALTTAGGMMLGPGMAAIGGRAASAISGYPPLPPV